MHCYSQIIYKVKERKLNWVSHVSISTEGFHVHYQSDDEKDEIVRCSEIRGAVAPPTVSAPGYYLIVGKLFEKNKSGRNALLFLDEGESGLQRDLFDKFISDLSRLKCQVVYTDQRQEIFFRSLYRQISKITKFYPSTVLEHDDPGIVLIRDWLSDKSIIIPKTHPTILKRELEKMTDDNTSYVINPLKLLLVGFEIQNELFLPLWGHEDRKKKLRSGLTGASRMAWEELDRIRQMNQDDDWTDLN
jgi:hypothetical protein